MFTFLWRSILSHNSCLDFFFKVPGGMIEDSRVLNGVMFNKDLTHARMRRRIENPRILLLDCSLEYKKGESQVSLEYYRGRCSWPPCRAVYWESCDTEGPVFFGHVIAWRHVVSKCSTTQWADQSGTPCLPMRFLGNKMASNASCRNSPNIRLWLLGWYLE